MKKALYAVLIPLSLCAQDVKVNGNSFNSEVFKSTNTSTNLSDRIAVSGVSTPAAYYGIGVQAEGGYIGVRSYALVPGSGIRYGVLSYGQGGNSENRGVTGVGYADNSSPKYGGHFEATGNGGTKYGVYGRATGTGTNYGVFCSGNGAYTGNWSKISDVRTKKNIQDYSGALDKVLALKVKRYEYKKEEFAPLSLKSTPEVGMLAQDVEKVLPELVQDIVAPLGSDPSKKNEEPQSVSLKGVDYVALVPILLQAVKEQQAQIESLKKKIGG